MTDRNTTHASFTIEKTYDATPAQVFKAFADEETKKKWLKGGEEIEYALDFRVGGTEVSKGRFHGGVVSSFIATYYDIVESERIVTAYEMYLDDNRISVSIGTTEIGAAGDKTKLVYTEQGAFLDGFDKPEVREQGTIGLLDMLGEFLVENGRRELMPNLRAQITMSLDGFVAGPDQSEENPLGVGGTRLHEWAFALEVFQKEHGGSGGEVNASTPVIERMSDGVGAVVMGRNMFGPIRGDWGDASWNGWWGEDPPYHVPVFVLTHYARESVEMEGGTTFHFVTDGVDSALDQAFEAAGGKDVLASGGASCVQQCFASGRVDELRLSLVPVLLGSGERLLDNLGDADITLAQIDVIEAPGVTHLTYAVSV